MIERQIREGRIWVREFFPKGEELYVYVMGDKELILFDRAGLELIYRKYRYGYDFGDFQERVIIRSVFRRIYRTNLDEQGRVWFSKMVGWKKGLLSKTSKGNVRLKRIA